MRNKPVRSALKTFIKKAQREIGAGNLELAQRYVHQAIRALDKAAEKDIIHANKAARHKSRLMRQLNRIAVGAAG